MVLGVPSRGCALLSFGPVSSGASLTSCITRILQQIGSILNIRVNFYRILIIFVLLGNSDSNNLIILLSLLKALIMVE